MVKVLPSRSHCLSGRYSVSNRNRILIVDDEQIALRNLEHIMKKEGYEITSTQSGQNALKLLEEQQFDLVLTDLKMEKVDGNQILKRCKELSPDTEVIMITGYASLQSAIQVMKKGAYDYVTKPFKLDEVRKVVKEALEKVALKKENHQLREQIEKFAGKVKFITQNPNMQRLLDTARQIA
ncbi:MAG: sigma-54-dependent Fis family transcriptional regulator, partial [Nitrospirae bacterium]|nr:sigma-54-dependent Fis family transcriptional regulator [Nitrospirota bacterium]